MQKHWLFLSKLTCGPGVKIVTLLFFLSAPLFAQNVPPNPADTNYWNIGTNYFNQKSLSVNAYVPLPGDLWLQLQSETYEGERMDFTMINLSCHGLVPGTSYQIQAANNLGDEFVDVADFVPSYDSQVINFTIPGFRPHCFFRLYGQRRLYTGLVSFTAGLATMTLIGRTFK